MQQDQSSHRMWALTLGALGIVFGDIGTSPLYAIRECFSEHYNVPLNPDNVYGILSLIIWSMIFIVSIKYIYFMLRADNKGEGGILALLALSLKPTKQDPSPHRHRWLLFAGLIGAALLYGDGMITPAISVLSAIEGLKVATPVFEPFVVPITIAILMSLFVVQSIGTARIGFVFGPIILVYFFVLGLLGLPQILNHPEILWSFSPLYGLRFFLNNGPEVFWVLGSVFLVLTGCEALYADMGHFGRTPIRRAWKWVVFPALVTNYLGQGSLLLDKPEAIANPFFMMAPDWALYPLVVIVALATVVASQALISGVYSLTQQAIQMGFCPRLEIVHTSSKEIGQIYMPHVNWALMVATIWLVFSFKTSSNLAGAYGIAVALTMFITTILAIYVTYQKWRWPLWVSLGLGGLTLSIEGVFLVANIVKIPHGGWFPLVTAGFLFTLMTTWKRGRRILAIRIRDLAQNLFDFFTEKSFTNAHRISGTGLFMASDPEMTPPALVTNVRMNQVIHQRVIVLSIATAEIPRVSNEKRIQMRELRSGFYQVTAAFGFMEQPDIHVVLESLHLAGLDVQLEDITFYLGRETILPDHDLGSMVLWRKVLFSFMSRNAYRAALYFRIPPEQVVEIGSQIRF